MQPQVLHGERRGPTAAKPQILLPPSRLSVSTNTSESTRCPTVKASVSSEIAPGAQWAERRDAVGRGHGQKGTTGTQSSFLLGTHVSVMGAVGGWNAAWPFPSLSLSFPPRKRKTSPSLCAFFPSVPPAAARETPSQATPSSWQRAENEQMVLGGRSPMEGEQHGVGSEHPGDGDVILWPRRDVCTESPQGGPAGWGAQMRCPPNGVASAETYCFLAWISPASGAHKPVEHHQTSPLVSGCCTASPTWIHPEQAGW